jgi:hypothetical protein
MKNATHNTFSKKAGHFNFSSQFFRKCSVGCIFYSVGPIIIPEKPCIVAYFLFSSFTSLSQEINFFFISLYYTIFLALVLRL